MHTLSHHDRAHKDLNRPDALERDLALPSRLVQPELVSELVLRHRVRMIDLVAQDDKGDALQLLHREEGVELELGFGEALVVLGVDEEDDARDLGEIVLPQAARW